MTLSKTKEVAIKVVSAIITLFVIFLGFGQVAPALAETTPNITVTQDMSLGSTGQNVVVLQGLLSELGYLHVPIGIPFGYYGPLTKKAVADYQSALNVSPQSGYFGPLTKIAMHQQFQSHNWLTLLGWI